MHHPDPATPDDTTDTTDDLRRALRTHLIKIAAVDGTAFIDMEAFTKLAEICDRPDTEVAILVRTAVRTVQEIRDAIALDARDRRTDSTAAPRRFEDIILSLAAEELPSAGDDAGDDR